MRKPNKLVDLSLHIHHETEKAILISLNGNREKATWLPKSQIEYEEDRHGGVEVTIPEWLAKEKELI